MTTGDRVHLNSVFGCRPEARARAPANSGPRWSIVGRSIARSTLSGTLVRSGNLEKVAAGFRAYELCFRHVWPFEARPEFPPLATSFGWHACNYATLGYRYSGRKPTEWPLLSVGAHERPGQRLPVSLADGEPRCAYAAGALRSRARCFSTPSPADATRPTPASTRSSRSGSSSSAPERGRNGVER